MVTNELTGVVIDESVENTHTVIVNRMIMHKRYKKIITKTKRYIAFDLMFNPKIGDIVRIRKCTPISKRKKWLIVNVTKKFVTSPPIIYDPTTNNIKSC